jgi:hypothetical protein
MSRSATDGAIVQQSASGEASEQASDRDSWCTPPWLTELLPLVDLDPCSNPRSTVRSRRVYDLARHEDGLALPWFGAVFVNPPYSSVLPWAMKMQREYQRVTSAAFLVNADPSTRWWHVLRSIFPLRFDFNRRIQFVPPPGVKQSSNSKPQALLCDEQFWRACDSRLAQHGTLWRRV